MCACPFSHVASVPFSVAQHALLLRLRASTSRPHAARSPEEESAAAAVRRRTRVLLACAAALVGVFIIVTITVLSSVQRSQGAVVQAAASLSPPPASLPPPSPTSTTTSDTASTTTSPNTKPAAGPGAAGESTSLSFLVVGDWGRQGAFNGTRLGETMGVVALDTNASFVLSVGDNVYEAC